MLPVDLLVKTALSRIEFFTNSLLHFMLSSFFNHELVMMARHHAIAPGERIKTRNLGEIWVIDHWQSVSLFIHSPSPPCQFPYFAIPLPFP
jgi:hypothetical protein